MDDAVVVALEKAARARCSEDGCCGGPEHCDGPWRGYLPEIVENVAAFLRALPDEFQAAVKFDSGNVDDAGFCEDWHLLAAAVERAGGGDV